MNKMNYSQDIVNRFWSKVNYPGNDQDCWEWTTGKLKKGYGQFWLNGKTVESHRFAYEFFNGIIPFGLLVCHTCDNPPCCNPEHLFSGTHLDNNRDTINKGRFIPSQVGENHYKTKLTNDLVEKILQQIQNNEVSSISEIASLYNEEYSVIQNILHGTTWTSITDKYDLQAIKNNIVKPVLSEMQILDIKNRLKNGETVKSIAKLYNITIQAIYMIKSGKIYSSVIGNLTNQDILNISNAKDSYFKLDENKVRLIRRLSKTYSISSIARMLNVANGTVRAVIIGQSWAHII